MPVAGAVGRQQFFQRQENIVRDGRIGVFVDGNRRRCVGAIYDRLPVGNAGLADNRLDLAGDINHLVAALRAHTELLLNYFHCYGHRIPKVNMGAKHQSAFGGFNYSFYLLPFSLSITFARQLRSLTVRSGRA